jgi:Kef-type K+ transport system membrane component KefB
MADLILLLVILVILAIPLVLSHLLRPVATVPLVVAQILFGIALGPSGFGRICPELFKQLFGPTTLAQLSGAASIAVLFFGFTTGLHLDAESFRKRGRGFATMSAASILIPTIAGFFGGLWIASRHAEVLGARGDIVQFSLAIAICLGVTALPVLGAILRETGLLGQRLGDITLGIAAVNDVVLWLLLAGLMTMAVGNDEGPGIVVTLLVLPIYLVTMICVVRPWLARIAMAHVRDGGIDEPSFILICVIAVGSAAVTQTIGLHYIFGAFTAGAITPLPLRRPLLDRLQVMTAVVLMPVFFVLTGLRTRIDPGSIAFLEIFFVTTVLAMLSKVGGTASAAVLVGETLSSALSIGALVQTKGLMEVIVLVIMLDRHIISETAFSGLTLMAVVTTASAIPLLRLAQLFKHQEAVVDTGLSRLPTVQSLAIADEVRREKKRAV